jgi:hypothetical protein
MEEGSNDWPPSQLTFGGGLLDGRERPVKHEVKAGHFSPYIPTSSLRFGERF